MNYPSIWLACLLAGFTLQVKSGEVFIQSIVDSPSPANTAPNAGATPKTPAEKLKPEELDRLVSALSSEDFNERENATKKLFRAAEYPVLCRLYMLVEKTQDTEVRGRVEQLIPAILAEMGDAIYDMDFQFLGPVPFPNEDAQGQPLLPQNLPNLEWIREPSPIDDVDAVDLKKEYTLQPYRGDEDAGADPSTKKKEMKVAWTRPFEGKRGVIDFVQMFPDHPQWASVFALTFIKAEKACRAKVFMGSDDGLGVWVNGKCAVFHDIRRAVVRDQDKFVIDLNPGWNPVLIRVANGWGGWGMSFRITQMNGMAWNEQDVSPNCRGEKMPPVPGPKQPKEFIKPGEASPASDK